MSGEPGGCACVGQGCAAIAQAQGGDEEFRYYWKFCTAVVVLPLMKKPQATRVKRVDDMLM